MVLFWTDSNFGFLEYFSLAFIVKNNRNYARWVKLKTDVYNLFHACQLILAFIFNTGKVGKCYKYRVYRIEANKCRYLFDDLDNSIKGTECIISIC